jgi:hypothetical protein
MAFVRFQDLEVYQLAEELADAILKSIGRKRPSPADSTSPAQ